MAAMTLPCVSPVLRDSTSIDSEDVRNLISHAQSGPMESAPTVTKATSSTAASVSPTPKDVWLTVEKIA
jgi:hypothetical protein